MLRDLLIIGYWVVSNRNNTISLRPMLNVMIWLGNVLFLKYFRLIGSGIINLNLIP